MWRKLVVLFVILLLMLPTSIKTQAQCMDSDGDGLCNNVDPCPNNRRNNCSDDMDGDGIEDSQDNCRNEAGVSSNNGCPAPDRDGDGTDDSQDRCPDTGGPSSNGGCPEGENTQAGTNAGNDGDGDGVADAQDQCPNQAGLASYNGCLPPLPEDGDCVAATNSNLRANIRQFPLLTANVVGQLDPTELIPILEKIDTPDSPFYRSENGWISGLVLRFGGDCDDVENPQPDPNCENSTDCPPEAINNTSSDCGVALGDIVLVSEGTVNVFNTEGEEISFMPYGASYRGGINVATGDVNGDGTADIITGAGAGTGPHVKVFDGATGEELRSFFAYEPSFTGGVFVAAGDIDGDGFADIITGAGAGAGPHVKAFSGATGTELRSFFAFDAGFTGGVRVAVGDVNGDGKADIITSPASPGSPAHVKVFDGATGGLIASFFAFPSTFTGGVTVAVGDLNGDCIADIAVGASAGGPPHVKVFNGSDLSLLASFFAYDPGFTGGVNVAIGDGNADGRPDLITIAPTTTGNHIKVFDGVSFGLLASFIE